MTVGRTSAFGAALTRSIAIIVLAGLLPGVKARCTIDVNGFERCDRLSSSARAGIAIGFFVVVLALLSLLVAYRRRRAAQAHIAYVQQSQPGGGQYGYGGQPPYAPQYPPQAHGGPHYAYDPNAGFAPPAASPPEYYLPPSGPPPFENKVAYHV